MADGHFTGFLDYSEERMTSISCTLLKIQNHLTCYRTRIRGGCGLHREFVVIVIVICAWTQWEQLQQIDRWSFRRTVEWRWLSFLHAFWHIECVCEDKE